MSSKNHKKFCESYWDYKWKEIIQENFWPRTHLKRWLRVAKMQEKFKVGAKVEFVAYFSSRIMLEFSNMNEKMFKG